MPLTTMTSKVNFIVALFTVVNLFFTANATSGCFSSFQELMEADALRGVNNSVPITRIICKNTVFIIEDSFDPRWSLNGNTNYLCGANGSSKNNCTLKGGFFQLEIAIYAYDFSPKDNILVSGFTFESAYINPAYIASPGKFTIKDCIFKNHRSHGVFQVNYYGEDPALDKSNRMLSTPHVKRRMTEHRQLLIGGGSQPRTTIHFDQCQFLNNSIPSNLKYPSFLSNGPFDVLSPFADVTVSNCLFKDNIYKYNFDVGKEPFLIRVESSASLNISDSCLVNNYISGLAPVSVVADSGLAATKNNFATDIPIDKVWDEPISPCQYLVLKEAWKCVAPESKVCRLPACAASFEYYNGRTNKFISNIVNGGIIQASPCGFNIKINLPCATTGKNATAQLMYPNNTIVKAREKVPPFFLYEKKSYGEVLPGTYKIRTLVDGVVQPSSKTFTISGTCTR